MLTQNIDGTERDDKIALSVIMPVYNEEGAIEDAVRDVQNHILNHVIGTEFIIVNDGSKDNTSNILDRMATQDDRIQVIHQENAGHGKALRTGLNAAQGDFVFLLDSDRQIELEPFVSLWPKVQSLVAIIGERQQRHDPNIRLFLTRGMKYFIYLLFKVSVQDANVPFKIVRRSAWVEISPFIPITATAPSALLAVAISCRYRSSVQNYIVTHRARATGEASLRYWRLLKYCGLTFSDLLTLRRNVDFNAYLKLNPNPIQRVDIEREDIKGG